MTSVVERSNDLGTEAAAFAASWDYEKAFSRHLGLISAAEQQRLRDACVAIPGMGGVGGVELATLARMGIGRFVIADPDIFEIANTNRQYGAFCSTLGRPKAETMAAMVRDINPRAEVCVFSDPVGTHNAGQFLRAADLLVDGMDLFEMDIRQSLFQAAASQGKYAVTGGPVGFSVAWLIFDPQGMSFDHYFDISNEMSELEKLMAFGLGLAPRATHRRYFDITSVRLDARHGPSVGAACELVAGVVATEVAKILLGRGNVRSAPYYQQFDPFVGRCVFGRLRGGNRHLLQRFKRWYLQRQLSNVKLARHEKPEPEIGKTC